MTRARRLVAETVGTALLLAAVTGSGIMAERLAGSNAALALLANALATGAALYALITAFAPLSGAHFNPLVTLALVRIERRPATEVAAYIAAQVSGALGGVWLTHLMFGLPLLEHATKDRSALNLMAGEVVATFGLLFVILSGVRAKSTTLPASVAAYITGAYWFTSSTSFANPAVTLARAFTDSFVGIRADAVPGFVLAQCAGAALAVMLAGWLFRDTDRE